MSTKIKFIDNLDNEIAIKACTGIHDKFMEPRRVKAHKMPCVKITFNNLHSKSARSCTIHLSKKQAIEVIEQLKTMGVNP